MRYPRWSRWAAMLLATMLLAACAAAPGSNGGVDPEAKQDESQDQAGGDAAIYWETLSIDQVPDEVAAWVEEQLGQIGITQTTVDDRTYILISWGEKPTGGHEVSVDDVQPLGDDALRLDITLTAPGEEDVVTQAFTYPYALVAVEPGLYYRLEPRFEGARFLENRSFRIDEPALFTEVEDGVRVSGEARVFEGAFRITVEDGHNVLAQEFVQVDGAPEWAPFDVTLELAEQPTSPYGVVIISTQSAQDGSVVDTITVPISFSTWE